MSSSAIELFRSAPTFSGPLLPPGGSLRLDGDRPKRRILHEMPVSQEEASAIETMFFTDIYQESALNAISKRLFGGGFHVVPKVKSNKTKEEFRFLVETYWTPFAKLALQHLYMFGYVVWAKVENREDVNIDVPKKQKIFIPRVLPRSYYEINTYIFEDYSKTYSVKATLQNFGKRARQEDTDEAEGGDTDFQLFIMPGCEPDERTGAHRSPCSSLMMEYKVISGLRRAFNKGIMQRCSPPILLEAIQEKRVEARPSAKDDTERFASALLPPFTSSSRYSAISLGRGGGDAPTAISHGVPERNVGASDMAPAPRFQNALAEERYLLDWRQLPFSQQQTPEDNVHFIEEGWTVGTQPAVPDLSPEKYLMLEDRYRDKVFASLFVPIALVYTALTIDDEDKHKMNQTMREVQELMVKLMENVYAVLFDTEELDVELKFPLYPDASITQISSFMEQDWISDEFGKNMILQIAGLPSEAYFDGENEHKRPRLNGNKESVKAFMDAMIDNMRADTTSKKADAVKTKAEAEVVGEEEGGDADLAEGEKQVLDKQIELEETKIEAKLKEIEAQMKMLKAKMVADKANASNQVKVNRSKPKPSAGGAKR